jgi:hypothetical protein
MRAAQKLVASFEGDGFVTDPSNASVLTAVHCRYDLWQEYGGNPPKPTVSRIVGVVEAKDPLVLFRFCEEQRKLELRTDLRSFNIYVVNSRGEFIACE